MAVRNSVNGADAALSPQYPQVGPAASSVKNVGRLLLRCTDRPGLVAAVSAFLAEAGANIVSLDQHATEQSGGTFMQRTIFHLPGLTAARDALNRDFGEQVAARFNMDFSLTEAPNPNGWRSWRPRTTTACWICCGATVAVNWTCRSNGDLQPSRPGRSGPLVRRAVSACACHQGHSSTRRTTPTRRVTRQRRPGGAGPLHADHLAPLPGRGRLPPDQHSPLIPAVVHRRRAVSAGQRARRQTRRRDRSLRNRRHSTTDQSSNRTSCAWTTATSVGDLIRLGADVERAVLSRAVLWHCEDRIIRDGNQTIVF